ncbi:hypothetical protein GCM10011575_32260 [Microlunatus endophyticus]|uniref:Uncharacterized protein n=1 Tax=Microlunatus endophyticus TaxID=1716077 RepID=A0A917W5G6_9ACTN|nr:DUF6507 family protein [Microlunatus endophyticus]GGL71468.1 hypothetical protein GCM10011575_32260 [Microlunatus endophyticus]
MVHYNVRPDAVAKVLKSTGSTADGLSTDLKPLSGEVTNAVNACGKSGAIVPALQGLFDHESTSVTNLITHIEACLTGAAAATAAYVEGDLDMMTTYQKNAAQGKISKIPKITKNNK